MVAVGRGNPHAAVHIDEKFEEHGEPVRRGAPCSPRGGRQVAFTGTEKWRSASPNVGFPREAPVDGSSCTVTPAPSVSHRGPIAPRSPDRRFGNRPNESPGARCSVTYAQWSVRDGRIATAVFAPDRHGTMIARPRSATTSRGSRRLGGRTVRSEFSELSGGGR